MYALQSFGVRSFGKSGNKCRIFATCRHMAGTWVRCMDGEKDWGVVDPASMSSSDWENFKAHGENWMATEHVRRRRQTPHLEPRSAGVLSAPISLPS